MEKTYDLAIAGGGPAGMAAAVQARKEGVERIILLERNSRLGGILPQCIHDGFGLEEFGRTMTGPEYALEWIKRVEEAGIEYHTDTAVFDAATVSRRETPQERSSETAPAGYRLKISSPSCGVESVFCRALVLASGCRERTRGQLRIPGGRPAGVYTAGAVQYRMHVQNYLPGRSAVVLGSGDIGLIMARRMKWEGIDVKMVLRERASGLLRNYIQCIKDWDIPIRFSHTVVQIHGRKRITGVTVAPVAKDGSPDLEGSQYIRCDLLVVAAGLIPETELWKKIYFSEGKVPCEIKSEDEISTQRSGVFVCGNVVRQYDTADEVSASGRRAGRSAARYLEKFREFTSGFDSDAGRNRNLLQAEDTEVLPDLSGRQNPPCELKEEGGKIPKHVMTEKDLDYLSSSSSTEESSAKIVYCICCPRGCRMKVRDKSEISAGGGGEISGFGCETGKAYALQETTAPKRIVTATVAVRGRENLLLPVKTNVAVEKCDVERILKMCRRIKAVLPVSAGDVIKSDLLGRGRNEGGAGGTGLRSSEDSAFEEGNFTARTGKCGSRVRRERVDLIACMDIDEAAAAEICPKHCGTWSGGDF